MTIAFQLLNLSKILIIALPNISIQKQIVKILDETFEKLSKAKENAETNLKNAKEVFESYLQRVFENKGEGWEEKELGEIGKSSMCKRIFKNETSIDGDIPFYKIGTFGKTPDAFISKKLFDEYKKKYRFPSKGSILISASGTIGRTVVYNGEPAYFQDSNIVWIDNDEKIVINRYLSKYYKYVDWGVKNGAIIRRLYNSILEKIKIKYPVLIQEQDKIASKIDSLSEQSKKLEQIYTRKLSDLDDLKQSILQKAFKGELTKEVLV